ncbi:MAG TPA: outer membrane lipoprotein chaperone LolA, partial [Acidobacteriota bacterium]
LVFLCWSYNGPLQAEDSLHPLVDAIQNRYDAIRSFSAGFTQIYRSGFSEEQESGIVYMKKPGRMRWEYTNPTIKLFVADGKKTYFYVPRDKQVTVAEWSLDSASTPLLFLLGRGHLQRDFEFAEATNEPKLAGGDTILILTPKTEQTSFKEVFLEVRRSDADILRLSIVEHNGNRNDYLLRSFRANIPIADEKFRFKIPKGVEVIQQ